MKLLDTFRRNGLDPAKYGVKDTPKKQKRQKLYTFVHNFDTEEKIRKMTWNTYNYKINYEDWHHIGGAFLEIVSNLFKKTNEKEENGINGMMCSIYKAPKTFIKLCQRCN